MVIRLFLEYVCVAGGSSRGCVPNMGTGSKAVLCVWAARSFLFEKRENRPSNPVKSVRAYVVPDSVDPG